MGVTRLPTETPGTAQVTDSDSAPAEAIDEAELRRVQQAIRPVPSKAIDADVPPGLNPDDVAPLTGDALAKALTPLSVLRSNLPDSGLFAEHPSADAPAPANEDTNSEAAPAASDDVPLATQRLYAAARQQLLEGRNADAVRLLETALRVSPDEPALLRLLGGGWASLGNRVRSMNYLEQAITANPDDLESAVLLGRFRIESGQSDAGLALLLDVLDREAALADDDAALPWLTRFYLSAGLRQAGYLSAAIAQLRAFLEGPRQGLRPTRHGAELVFVDRQRAAHAVVLGDMHSRLGDPLAARRAYAAAEFAGGKGADMIRRVVYADLRLGRLDQAGQRVVELVGTTDGAPAALALVEYAVAQGVAAGPIVAALRSSLQTADGPEAVTLALASAMPRQPAIDLLGEHLDAAPGDVRVYDRLVELLAGEDATTDDRAHALRRAADAMAHDPARASRRAGALLAMAPDPAPLLAALDGLAPEQRQRPEMLTLEAVIRFEAGDHDAASDLLDRVLAAPDPPPLARIEKARLLALRSDYAGADAMLATLGDDVDDPRLGRLRVGILINLDRHDEAARLLDTLAHDYPADPWFVLEKARLLVRRDRAPDAERTLMDALQRDPRQEAYYAELLRLYDHAGTKLENTEQSYLHLLGEMRKHVPASRTFQLALAGLLEVRSSYDQAEKLLDALLERDPGDVEARIILVDVYHKTNRPDAADALVEALLAEHPNQAEVIDAARTHFARTGKAERLAEIEERWLRSQPDSLPRNLRLIKVLGEAERWDDALGLFDDALAHAEPKQHVGVMQTVVLAFLGEAPFEKTEPVFSDMVKDQRYEFDARRWLGFVLSEQYTRAGREQDIDPVLLALLTERPDDPELSNHLGYMWAYQGRNLEHAQAMIETAVQAEPDSAAYLDSMGWVLYKRGYFAAAEAWLRRAIAAPGGQEPVLLDHLGDALYQQGKSDEAADLWKQARTLVDTPAGRASADMDPETATITKRTTAKLDALERGPDAGDVPVAPAQDPPADGDADAPQPPPATAQAQPAGPAEPAQ